MKARALRKRPGRKPKRSSALQRRPTCHDCRFRAPSGACLDPVLTSGRCGDYVRYVRGNKQYRRLYVKPTNPRTSTQQRWRSRFGAASSKYSHSLTEGQQDARIAAGAKLRSRPRLGQSGPLTGQQYSIRREFGANANSRLQQPEGTAKVPQLQRVARKYKSQAPQPQRFMRSTPGLRRGWSGTSPGHRRRNTAPGNRSKGRRKHEEYGRQSQQPGTPLRQSQRVTRIIPKIYRGGRWAKPRQVPLASGRFRLSGRANVLASPNLSRPPATRSARGRSPSSRLVIPGHRH
jgi:hypothetical protein